MDEPTPARRASLRRRIRRLLLVGIVLAGGPGLWAFRNPLFRNNFGVVVPHRVYRSAQPGPELRGLVEARGIASVLNLRGGSWSDRFYADEVALTRARGLAFYDLPMSASRRPSRRELLMLLDLFDRCRYPLLVHCKSGSDRTGLVSGLYLMAHEGKPPREALESFSLYYGHVPLLGPERLHEPLVEYDAWLTEHQRAHSPEQFRAWLEREYRSDPRDVGFRPLPEGPRDSYRRHQGRWAARPLPRADR